MAVNGFQRTGRAFQGALFAFQQTIESSGGGGPDKSDSSEYWYWLERARKQLAAQAEMRRAIREEAEEIPDQTDREIAVLLKKQEAKDEIRKELAELQRFADVAAKQPDPPNRKLAELIKGAATARTNTALLTLQREMARIDEEEEALIMTLLLMQ